MSLKYSRLQENKPKIPSCCLVIWRPLNFYTIGACFIRVRSLYYRLPTKCCPGATSWVKRLTVEFKYLSPSPSIDFIIAFNEYNQILEIDNFGGIWEMNRRPHVCIVNVFVDATQCFINFILTHNIGLSKFIFRLSVLNIAKQHRN